MEADATANDNRRRDHNGVDPGRDVAREGIARACADLKARGIDRKVVASAMLDEMFRLLDGNPFRTWGDEGAIRADLNYLWSIKRRVLPMVEQWEKGWVRLQYERRPKFQFNRAARKERPQKPRRLRAPLPDYDAKQHAGDLLMLKLRPGHAYTEREVMARYRRKMLKVLDNRHVDGVDRVQTLAASKKRVLGWLRRTAHLVTDQTTG